MESSEVVWGLVPVDFLAPYLFVIVLDYALRMTIDGKEEELGFHLERSKSRRIGPIVVTDLDFADDIALLSMDIRQAQELILSVERCVGKVGLKINAGKTKYMSYNQHESVTIKFNDGSILEEVGNFKCLGAWMHSTERDVKQRKAAAWRASSKLSIQNMEIITLQASKTTPFCCNSRVGIPLWM